MEKEKCILISNIHFVHRRSPLGSGHFVSRRLLWAGGTTTEAPVRRHGHVKNNTFHCARKSIRQKAAEADFSETYLVGILSEKKPNQAPSQVPSALVQEAEKSNISRHAITWSKCITQFSCWSGIGVKSAGTQNNKYDPPKSRSFCSFLRLKTGNTDDCSQVM